MSKSKRTQTWKPTKIPNLFLLEESGIYYGRVKPKGGKQIRTRENGKHFVWNYWDPAGPWDFKPDGSPRPWVGVHPKGGYYEIDVEGIVSAADIRAQTAPERPSNSPAR